MIAIPSNARHMPAMLLVLLIVSACGGGGGAAPADATLATPVEASTPQADLTSANAVPTEQASAVSAYTPLYAADSGTTPAVEAAAGTPLSSDAGSAPIMMVIQAAPAATPRAAMVIAPISATTLTIPASILATGDAASPTAMLGFSAAMASTAFVQTNVVATTGAITSTKACTSAYVPPATVVKSSAVALPVSGGIFFTTTELATWKQRVAAGPFVNSSDYKPGSPGDWARIRSNAQLFSAGSEKLWLATNDAAQRATHGSLLRDAAFYQLITQDKPALAQVRARLLAEAANPLNDFTKLCLRELNGSMLDASFSEASWLLRYIVSYDFVRSSLAAADRLIIENFVRRNSYFFASQLDSGLALLFPDRMSGSYVRKARDAAAAGTAVWASTQVDTNGDCKVDALDTAAALPVYNYAKADGSLGPRTSWLSQWYNNRKAVNATVIAAAGVLLGDGDLVASGKRYVMEWLTYGVWADGSQGEYMRNGEYCIPQQGVIYSSANTQAGLMIGRLLSRQGDATLFAFRTRDGLFGTASQATDADKSLELVAGTHYRLITRQLPWYAVEAQKTKQAPREATHLGRTEVRYMATGNSTDDFHELGLLMGAAQLPKLPLTGLAMRDASVTTLRFPGSTGYSVATGFGSWVGSWTDAFNALPSMFLLR